MNGQRSGTKDVPTQIKIPALVALGWLFFMCVYTINHVKEISGELLSFLVLSGFFVAQFVSIAWGCKKIPKLQIAVTMVVVLGIFYALHHFAEHFPPFFLVVDFIILQVVCVALGVIWRHFYYKDQIGNYQHDKISNFIQRLLDLIIKLCQRGKVFISDFSRK